MTIEVHKNLSDLLGRQNKTFEQLSLNFCLANALRVNKIVIKIFSKIFCSELNLDHK